MTDDPVKQAIIELQDLVRCRCLPAYTVRKLRDPDCDCDSAENVKVVVDRIKELETQHANDCEEIAKWREIFSGRTISENFEVVWRERLRRSEDRLAKAVEALESICLKGVKDESIYTARTTIAELKGDKP